MYPTGNTTVDTQSKSIAIVTMCHRSDIDRCRLLVQTVDHFVSPHLNHYIIVDKRDRKHFDSLNEGKTNILCVEEILPWWIFRAWGVPGMWLSLKTPPFRDWILQQLVKLAIPPKIDEDIIINIDTDVAFVRPFNPYSYIRDGKVRLFRVPDANSATQCHWHRTVGPLLGLDKKDYYGASFVGNLISWTTDNVERLHKHIESVSGRPWLETLCMPRNWHLAEYLLYGVYIDNVLGLENSGHWLDETNPCLGYWKHEELNETQIREFLATIQPEHVAVMIASYAGVPADRYARLLEESFA